MIVGLSGFARSGKDTVANILVKDYGFKRVAFADALKDFVLEVNPFLDSYRRVKEVVDEYGWDVVKGIPEGRRILQEVGLQVRNSFGEDSWIKKTHVNLNGYSGNVVFTDVRFQNEAQYLASLGGLLWRVERPGTVAANNHVSEHDLDNWGFDRYIHNSTTIEDLEFIVKMALQHDF